MTKILLSMPDLRRRALAEIRKQDGCHNVQEVAINRVTDERAGNNWSLCVLSAGAADANTAARAAIHVQGLRRDYDLMTDRRQRRLVEAKRIWPRCQPQSHVFYPAWVKKLFDRSIPIQLCE
jgi:hypothetical protein